MFTYVICEVEKNVDFSLYTLVSNNNDFKNQRIWTSEWQKFNGYSLVKSQSIVNWYYGYPIFEMNVFQQENWITFVKTNHFQESYLSYFNNRWDISFVITHSSLNSVTVYKIPFCIKIKCSKKAYVLLQLVLSRQYVSYFSDHLIGFDFTWIRQRFQFVSLQLQCAQKWFHARS
jgi:hypothetical protein